VTSRSYLTEERRAPPETSHALEIERLYREDGPRLWRAIRAFTGDPDVTNDVVAEAFAQCLRRGSEIRSPQRWIWRAAFWIARGQLKEMRRSTGLNEDQIVDPPDIHGELAWALAQLSPRQRAVVILRHYMGLSPTEIAGILGSAPPTVRVHLMRGLRRLRDLMEVGHGGS
jgi:RNA polymerase sigma factor (sigma-70 family)